MTELRDRHMRLSLLASPQGWHAGAWRLPEAPNTSFCEISRFVEMAQIAERGFFDLFFVADVITLMPSTPEDIGRGAMSCVLDPFTILSALSTMTSEIGLAGTMTTSYTAPYFVARSLASLDHISGGRAAWNLVTSSNPNEALVFGLAPVPATERYRKAREFADLVFRLWDSWDDDAFIFDAKKGQFFDPKKMHPISHEGEFFKLNGMLSLPRSPQGRPVMTQAGQSEAGMMLAAETADIVFAQQPDFETAKKFYKGIKDRAAAVGRSPDDVFVMPGFMPFVARTDAEARAKLERANQAFDINFGLQWLSMQFGINMSVYELDEPLPKNLPEPDKSLVLSQRQALIDVGERDNLTLRQLVQMMATVSHRVVCGTPEKVADEMERYFMEGAADAFNIVPGVMHEDLISFVELVVPELQRRGLVRTASNGKTLREKFGLKRPNKLAS